MFILHVHRLQYIETYTTAFWCVTFHMFVHHSNVKHSIRFSLTMYISISYGLVTNRNRHSAIKQQQNWNVIHKTKLKNFKCYIIKYNYTVNISKQYLYLVLFPFVFSVQRSLFVSRFSQFAKKTIFFAICFFSSLSHFWPCANLHTKICMQGHRQIALSNNVCELKRQKKIRKMWRTHKKRNHQ